MLRKLFMTSKSTPSLKSDGKVAKSSPTKSDTVVGSGAVIDGSLSSEGNIRIDGTVKGTVTAKGNIQIGNSGEVLGNLKGKTIHIGGIVRGDIDATAIAILKTGRVWGDLTTTSLSTEEGGFIQGAITMQHKDKKLQTSKNEEKMVQKLPPELEAQVAEAISRKSSKK